MRNAAEMGEYLLQGLRELQRRYPELIADVRGKGLMIGVELVTDSRTRKPAREFAERLLHNAWRQGLLLLTCGVSTLRLMPPLMIDRATCDEALALLDAAIEETLGA
ncbi:5-aminovalerate aminotransferase DavT [compost metagenome]